MPRSRPRFSRLGRDFAGLEERVVPAYTFALAGTAAALTGDAAALDTLVIDQSGGFLRHNRDSAGDANLDSDLDWSNAAGVQTLSATDPAVTVTIDMGGGADTLQLGSATAAATSLAAAFTLSSGGPGNDRVIVNDTARATPAAWNYTNTLVTAPGFSFNNLALLEDGEQYNLGSGGNTFTVTSQSNTLAVTGGGGADTLTLQSGAGNALRSFVGGGGADRLVLADGVGLNGGTFDGGADTDTLDYAAYTAPLAVNLGLGAQGFTADIDGSQPTPGTASTATGTATGGAYAFTDKRFDLTVTVSGVTPAELTGLTLNRGEVEIPGLVVADLLALGTPVAAGTGFTLTLPGLDLDNFLLGGRANEAALLGGLLYLNVTTAAAPAGLIRGQVFPTSNENETTGTATGTAGVSNVEDVVGGSAGDSLVGNSSVNVLTGGAGNDDLRGGPGSDTFLGGAENDTLIWSNGDGTDVMDGQGGTDTVVVNGNLTANDVYTIGQNGTRIDFDRVSPGPFSLDIGTVENLRVNGAGGNDTFTGVVPDGTALLFLGLYGLAGDDTFNVVPQHTIGSARVVGGTGTDTITVDYAGTTNPFLSADTDAAGGRAGRFTFGNRNPVVFLQLENLEPPANFLTVTKTDGLTTATAGTALTYTVTVTNNGPVGLTGVTVTDLLPPQLTGATWTAAFSAGSTGTPSGAGDILQAVNLAAGGSVTYTVTGTIDPVFVGPLTNTAAAAVPTGLLDTNPDDNTATDTTPVVEPEPAALPATLVVSGAPNGSVLRYPASGGQFRAPFAAPVFPGFPGEIHVAQGDVDGDGVPDIVAATGAGGGQVKVLRGSNTAELFSFIPFPGYAGGLFVAVGDLTGDGRADIAVTPDATNAFSGPINRELPVRVYSGADLSVLASFNGLADLQGRSGENDGTRLGGRPAIADVNGDGAPDLLIAAGNGGGPRVTVWSGLGFPGAGGGKPTVNPITNLFVFESSQRGGAFVTAGDVNDDGVADIIVGGGPGGGPRVRIVDGAKLFGLANLDVNLDDPANLANGLVLNNFFAGDLNRRGGVRVAVVDVDGDDRADLVTGSGTGEASSVRVYTGQALTAAFGSSNEPGLLQLLDPFGGAVLPGGVWVG